MPARFVFAIIFLVLTAALLAWDRSRSRLTRPAAAEEPSPDEAPPETHAARRQPRGPVDGRAITRGVRAATVISGVLTIVLLVFSCLTQVSTKEFGVKTSFGRPVGSLTNGLHLKAPWEEVTEIDAAIQTDSHVQGSGDDGCLQIRIAHQIVACADASIRWRIQDGAADSLFQNYRDFDNIRISLVTRELSAALNKAFESYDPLAVDADGNSTAPQLSTLADQVQQQMQQEIGSQITVLSVIVPVINFDATTQGRINALQAQIAQTRIAQQAIQTATDQAQANAKLAGSVSKDPNVLVSKCYDLVSEMIAKGQAVPVNFSCWPNSQSGVVVPATK